MTPHNQVVRVAPSNANGHTVMQKEDLQKLSIPDTPGVYFFVGVQKEILYIGKATNLKDRVRSYFSPDIIQTRGPKIQKILSESVTVSWQTTDSVLEALILEAALIKKHQPLGNTKEKDNKSFNHIGITHEDFPRVLIIRGRDIEQKKTPALHDVFGPFPQGSKLKEALKIIRKIFPFRDTCSPCPRAPLGHERCKPCFNAQIGLCPGVCSGAMTQKEYARTIQHLTAFLKGEKQTLIQTLTKEMNVYAKKEQFEEAERTKKQLYALNHIRDIALITSEPHVQRPAWADRESLDRTLHRIEAYDVAHMSEASRVGVMTVAEDGVPKKSDYRKFIIKHALPGDVHALAEMLERRLAHTEWELPALIVVDGNMAQIRTAQRIIKAKNLSIPVVGVVKDERHKPKNIVWPRTLLGKASQLEKTVLLTNAEAHRFAITFYRTTARRALTKDLIE